MRRRDTGPSRQVRQMVADRADGCCERCGGPLAGYVSVHHRKPRRAGGTRDAAVNGPSNLMMVCGSGTTGCHGWVESHRADAYTSGWLLYAGDDPARVPVVVWGRGIVVLTAQGGYEPV